MLILMATLFLKWSAARKSYLTKHADAKYVPHVSAFDCSSCVVDDASSKVCLD